MRVSDICRFMETFAPQELAESWDNTGLLLGNPEKEVSRVMTCLTVTPESAAEAVARGADMIVSHHPLPFRAMKRITTETTTGRLVMELIRADIALYAPHTSFDSAPRGINQQIAEGLGLVSVLPFQTRPDVPGGTGRLGELPVAVPLRDFLGSVKAFFGLARLQYVGELEKPMKRVAIGCGAAGEFLEFARRFRCDVFLTGETNFHTFLEAKATDTALVLLTHFASEKFACVRLAEILATELPGLDTWSSTREAEPLQTF
ncbi:MAG: Nif3-like dinuclear metal center hexameric protein [Planctomycetia bacterium]|nr:Nif3-like dinuclear metal center hexameric protein [Planctomycetia bacterium]